MSHLAPTGNPWHQCIKISNSLLPKYKIFTNTVNTQGCGAKGDEYINKQPDSQQSHSFCWPLGGTRHRCHLSRAASFVRCIAAITGLHVASRVGELVVRHSWGQRPGSRRSRGGLGRRAWLWVAGVEGRLWRTPLEQRLSHLRVTVVVLVCSRGFSLKLKVMGVRMCFKFSKSKLMMDHLYHRAFKTSSKLLKCLLCRW